MIVDENDFFRQATLRICSSLEIEKAMLRCLEFLEKFIPASEMYLNLYEPGLGVIRNLAFVTRTGSRKAFTAKQISKEAINQIESGRSQPSYETAKKIFDQLASLEGQRSPHKAGDFCSKDIVKIKPSNTLHDAIEKMHKFSISQIPVFDGNNPVGVVSDDGIMRHLADVGESELKHAQRFRHDDQYPPGTLEQQLLVQDQSGLDGFAETNLVGQQYSWCIAPRDFVRDV